MGLLLGAANGVEVVHDDQYGGRPSAAESRALARAVRLTEKLMGPFQRGATKVHWRTPYESMGRMRGWIHFSPAPVHAYIRLDLPEEDWLPRGEAAGTLWTAAHELRHVCQSLAGLRPTFETEPDLEHEADTHAGLVLEVWLAELREAQPQPRALAAGRR